MNETVTTNQETQAASRTPKRGDPSPRSPLSQSSAQRIAVRAASGQKCIVPATVSETTASETAAPELFTSLNYREYLSRWFACRKRLQSSYSGAIFAKKAGVSSHTLLGMVIRGERNLSPATTRGFVRAMGLKGREALYFEKLVFFNQSKNSEDRAYYFEQLTSISSSSSRELITKIKDHASYLSHWYNVAIREMVGLEDFTSDPEWIARKLKNKITKKQAEEAFALLLKIGMVKKAPGENGDDGKYIVVDPSIDIDPGLVDFAIRNFHREYLDRAKDAIDGESLDEREFSSLTLSVSDEDYALLKERIKEFRKKLNQEFPLSQGSRRRVVAVNLQALSLTEKPENPERDRE